MLTNICQNCGKDIRVMIFKNGLWCSDYCRKVILGQIKCTYEEMWTDEVGVIDVCVIHGTNSKYSSRYGPTRPCLEVEGYDE